MELAAETAPQETQADSGCLYCHAELERKKTGPKRLYCDDACRKNYERKGPVPQNEKYPKYITDRVRDNFCNSHNSEYQQVKIWEDADIWQGECSECNLDRHVRETARKQVKELAKDIERKVQAALSERQGVIEQIADENPMAKIPHIREQIIDQLTAHFAVGIREDIVGREECRLMEKLREAL